MPPPQSPSPSVTPSTKELDANSAKQGNSDQRNDAGQRLDAGRSPTCTRETAEPDHNRSVVGEDRESRRQGGGESANRESGGRGAGMEKSNTRHEMGEKSGASGRGTVSSASKEMAGSSQAGPEVASVSVEKSTPGDGGDVLKAAGGSGAVAKGKRLLKKGHAPPGVVEEDVCDIIRDDFWNRNPHILAGVERRR